MLITKITQTYRFPIPIISAGMACVATPKLAAAVSNAGGMGTFSAAMADPEGLRQLIREARRLTAYSFGVDFITSSSALKSLATCSSMKEQLYRQWEASCHGRTLTHLPQS